MAITGPDAVDVPDFVPLPPEVVLDNPLTKTRMERAGRYQKVAGEYYDLAKAAFSPFLQEYFQRTAKEYRVRAQGELRVLEREGAAANARPET